MYAVWETPHGCTRSQWIFADGSVHRIVAAGDLNIYRGYGERGSGYWAGRCETVFAGMAALGLPFVGPQLPNGRPAHPRQPELPEGCINVPTYYTSHQAPATASHQLDFVFASSGLADRPAPSSSTISSLRFALCHTGKTRTSPTELGLFLDYTS